MRKLQSAGLVALGCLIGAGVVALGTRTNAQVSSADLNARFVMGNFESVTSSQGKVTQMWFRFVKDKKTGDCYILRETEPVKTDDNACDGL